MPVESAKPFDTIFMRLLAATDAKSESDFARSIGITPQSVNGARKRGKVPPDWVQSVAERTGVSSDWLFFGRGPFRLEGGSETSPQLQMEPALSGILRAGDPLANVVAPDYAKKGESQVIECDTSQLVMVPMVEARLSAGTGSFENGGKIERFYAFRLDFLQRKGVPSQMVLMRVSGDSMEPEIKDGDVVLIDQNQKTPIPGKLYAVGVEDMVYIKEVNAEPGKLVLSSYNKDYSALELDSRGDLQDGIRIIGRAVWVGRELK